MGHSNVHMMRQRNSAPYGSVYDFSGEQAVGPLPHEQQALIRRSLETKLIWKVEIWVEQDHFVIVPTE
jgi:hypothetical protein